MGDDPEGASILSQLFILLLLTLINGFFSCAEMAMVSIKKSEIKRLAEEGNKKAIMVQNFQYEPTKFLSTIQIAITFAGFFSSASAATGLSTPLGNWINRIFAITYAERIAFILVTLILALLTLIFGELVPKRIALQNPNGISLFSVRIIKLVSVLTTPIINFLTFCTNLVMKLLGSSTKNADEKVSKEEIKSLIKRGQTSGTLDKKEYEMINSIIEFNDKLAKEVMTPKVNVFTINILQPIDIYLPELLEIKYSRVPIYEDDTDNIIGVLNVKDYIKLAVKDGFNKVDLKSIMTEPFLVPETKNVGELLKEMQLSKNHFAILIDEFGGFAGIVTLRDLVEEVMGDFEEDFIDSKIKKIDNSTYLIDGLMTIDELNSKLDLNLCSDNYETISGLLIDLIGFIPKEHDNSTIEMDHLVFKLQSIKKKRIDKVKLYIGKKNITDDNNITDSNIVNIDDSIN